MKTTKIYFLALAVLTAFVLTLTSCEKDEEFLNPEPKIADTNIVISQNGDTLVNGDSNNVTDTTVGYHREYVNQFDLANVSKLKVFSQPDGFVDSIWVYDVYGDTTFVVPMSNKIEMHDANLNYAFSTIENMELVSNFLKMTADFVVSTYYPSSNNTTGIQEYTMKSATIAEMSTVMVNKEDGTIETIEETPVTDGAYVVLPNNDWTWVNNAGLTVTFSDESSSKTGSVININNAEFATMLADNYTDFFNTTGYEISSPSNFACTKTIKLSNGDVYGYITFIPNSNLGATSWTFVTVVKIISSGSFSLSYVKTSANYSDFNNSFNLLINDNTALSEYGYTPDMRSLIKGNKVISQINTGTLDSYVWMKGYMFAPSFTMYDLSTKNLNAFTNPSNTISDGYNNHKLTSKMILFGDYIYYITEEDGSNYVTKIQISTINTTSQLNVVSAGSKIITTAIESISTTENGYFILTNGTTNYFIYEDGHMTTGTTTPAGDVINF
jgi:hypothetical protein